MRSKYDNRLLEEAYKNVLSESDDSAGKIPVSAVEDLSFITVADRTSHKWVTWEVSFVYQGQEYTGFLGAVPDHPSEMHDDYIEDAEPVQTPALDEAEESENKIPVDDVEDLAFEGIADRYAGRWVIWDVSFEYQGKQYTGQLGAAPEHPDVYHDDYIENVQPVADEAEEGSSSTAIDRFYSKLEDFVDRLSDEELAGGLQIVKTKPRELIDYLKDEFNYRNAIYNDFN